MVRKHRTQQGFTMIEIMIVVAMVAILSAIAIPNYRDYVLRGRLTEAYSGLSDARTKMEAYFADNRTYPTGGCVATGTPSSTQILTMPLSNFAIGCGTPTGTAYTVTATGSGPASGFVFTIDQAGVRATTGVPTGWTTSTSCWVTRKDGSC
jgi:type IV pilus assembly protein PilE